MSDLKLSDRKNEIVVVTGRKGSGKSTLLSKHVAQHFPRVLTVDWTGEARELYPEAIEVVGVHATLDAMQSAYVNRDTHWRFIVLCDPSEVADLCRALVPKYDGKTVPIASLVGGCAIECHEMHLIAPVSGAGRSAEIMDAMARSRHARLSWLCAARRPAELARFLTAQTDSLYSARMHEPRDLSWLSNAGGDSYAKVVAQLKEYHFARYDSTTGEITVLDPKYASRRVKVKGAKSYELEDEK
jgi:energy-coupling factor transporter ATP-binding protein EcfA2